MSEYRTDEEVREAMVLELVEMLALVREGRVKAIGICAVDELGESTALRFALRYQNKAQAALATAAALLQRMTLDTFTVKEGADASRRN